MGTRSGIGRWVRVAALALAAPMIALAGGSAADKGPDYVLGYTMVRIDGTPQDLREYEGKVVLIVNVASACGLTPQYAGLEKLYQSRASKGFVVLGFPANNFGNQEPGSNEEIAEFCSSKFSVTFPMFEKVSVKGSDRCPLYAQLSDLPPPKGGEPSWNFTKFLVDREGRVVQRFDPRTPPDDAGLTARIDELLSEKP